MINHVNVSGDGMTESAKSIELESAEAELVEDLVPDDYEEFITKLKKLLGDSVSKKLMRFTGGDYHIADELLPRIHGLCPSKCTLVEVFGGSGIVSQEADRNKFPNVVYNDIDNKLVTFYKLAKEKPRELTTLLLLLPFARSYYKIVHALIKGGNTELAALELAALTFYIVNASFYGKGGFAYLIEAKRNEAVGFRKRVLSIPVLASKWADVTIENLDFRDVIDKYDSEATVFYLDPPYPDRAGEYYNSFFTTHDLRDMAYMLKHIKGKFLLKLDDRTYSLIQDLLPEEFYRVERIEKVMNMDKKRGGEKRRKWTLVLVSSMV